MKAPRWWRVRARQRRRRDEMAVIGAMLAHGGSHSVIGLMHELGLSSGRVATALARLESRKEVRYRVDPGTSRFTYYL